MSRTGAISLGRVQLTPPSVDDASTILLPTLLSPSSQNTYTVPSGPVRTADPWRPPTVPLLCAAESWFGRDQVAPPSAENVTMIGSPKNVKTLPRNCVQETYTRPKKGEDGFLSAQTSSLSLNLKPWPPAATTGASQLTPSSSERETASSSGA